MSLTATCQSERDFQTKRSLFRSQNWTCIVSQIKKYKIIIVYEQYKHIFYCDIDRYIIYMHYTAIRSLLLILSRFIGLPRFSYLPLQVITIGLFFYVIFRIDHSMPNVMNARRPVPNTNSYPTFLPTRTLYQPVPYTNSYHIPNTCNAWFSGRVRTGCASACSRRAASDSSRGQAK